MLIVGRGRNPCGIATPCGLTAAGLPIGLQFVAARGADAKVLSAARDFERASP
jgi:aspartyl-tRNA(Asn)/glutamyl-tRNA(Gln) amidotransferase subunit A